MEFLRDTEALVNVVKSLNRYHMFDFSTSELEATDIEKIKPHLDVMLKLAGYLKGTTPHILPQPVINESSKCIGEMLEALNWLEKSYTPRNHDLKRHLDSYIGKGQSAEEKLTSILGPWIPFLQLEAKGIMGIQNELADVKTEIRQEAVTLTNHMTTALDKATAELEAIENFSVAAREAAEQEGISAHERNFHQLSKDASEEASSWLAFTVILGVFTLCLAFVFPLLTDKFLTTDLSNWQIFTSKFTALFVFIGATAWCGKNFRAAKHQEFASKQKATALKTYNALTGATKDAEVKATLLIEVTRMIFGQSSSGMVTESSGGAEIRVSDISSLFKTHSGGN